VRGGASAAPVQEHSAPHNATATHLIA